jgi:hypothetical protein
MEENVQLDLDELCTFVSWLLVVKKVHNCTTQLCSKPYAKKEIKKSYFEFKIEIVVTKINITKLQISCASCVFFCICTSPVSLLPNQDQANFKQDTWLAHDDDDSIAGIKIWQWSWTVLSYYTNSVCMCAVVINVTIVALHWVRGGDRCV